MRFLDFTNLPAFRDFLEINPVRTYRCVSYFRWIVESPGEPWVGLHAVVCGAGDEPSYKLDLGALAQGTPREALEEADRRAQSAIDAMLAEGKFVEGRSV